VEIDSLNSGDELQALSQDGGDRWETAQVCEGEIESIPSLFGQLVYLASLLDQASGQYRHYSLPPAAGEDETDRLLRRAHCKAFAAWLCSTLEKQRADLELYLSNLEVNRQAVLGVWLQLFVSDLERLLAMMAAGEAEQAVIALAPQRAAVTVAS
jgi:hypothetical protein